MNNHFFDGLGLNSIFTFIKAFIIGTIPSLAWLMFWLREDREHAEPKRLIFATFLGGMLMVLLALPLQKLMLGFSSNEGNLIPLWAMVEEILKYLIVVFIIVPTNEINEPIDYAIYMIVAGLGFAALENTLYILKPLLIQDQAAVFLTGNLRFLGSTLLHATASGIIGLMIGLSFYQTRVVRTISGWIGVFLAILLHSTFNFFIMKEDGKTTLQIFVFLWVVTSITILVFEKLRRMSGAYEPLEEE